MEKSTVGKGTQDVEGQGLSGSGTSQGEHLDTSAQEKQLVASLLESETASKLLDKMVEERAQKYMQSNKDKRLAQVEENKSRLDRLEELVEGKGMSFEDAKAQIQREDEQAEIKEQLARLLDGKAGKAGDDSGLWTERESAILASQGLDPKDPELIRFKAKFNDPEEYIRELPKKAFEMATRPGGSEGSASGGQGNVVKEDLESEYEKELAQIRRGDYRSIDRLKRKYRKLGYEVW